MTEEQLGRTLKCLCKGSVRLIETNQTSLATNHRVVVGCKKMLQKVECSSTLCNKICTCCAFYRP